MGGSLAALRILPALAGTALVGSPSSSRVNSAVDDMPNSSLESPFWSAPPF